MKLTTQPFRVWCQIGWGERFVLHPNELVLAATLEYIVLPNDLTGTITSRSTYGRLGLLTVTASQVQPGSANCITLELLNEGRTPLELSPGLRIAQLRLYHVDGVAESDVFKQSEKYNGAVRPQFPKVRDDPDQPALRLLNQRRGRRGHSVSVGIPLERRRGRNGKPRPRDLRSTRSDQRERRNMLGG